ncbi:MAG: VanZ family protein [Betaproteobacteria bacterium]|nr:VanZ family protein [Betaproteobacteria bacterium]
MDRSPALRWRATWLALGWLLLLAIVGLSLAPRPPQIDLPQGDKLGHAVAYGAAMWWFCQIYRSGRARAGYAIGFVALGIAIEFAQRATGYRSYEELDMLADAAGVALGWVIARFEGGRLFARIEAILARKPIGKS